MNTQSMAQRQPFVSRQLRTFSCILTALAIRASRMAFKSLAITGLVADLAALIVLERQVVPENLDASSFTRLPEAFDSELSSEGGAETLSSSLSSEASAWALMISLVLAGSLFDASIDICLFISFFVTVTALGLESQSFLCSDAALMGGSTDFCEGRSSLACAGNLNPLELDALDFCVSSAAALGASPDC
jgi:hypothetical protein